MGSRRSLAGSANWQLSTAASDTQCKRVFVASIRFNNASGVRLSSTPINLKKEMYKNDI